VKRLFWRILGICSIAANATAGLAQGYYAQPGPMPSGDLIQRLDGTLESIGGPGQPIMSGNGGLANDITQEIPPTCSSSADIRPGYWFLDVEFAELHRFNGVKNTPIRRVLAQDIFGPPTEGMTFAAKGFDLAPGTRITLGRYLDSCEGSDWDRSFELTFWGLFQFETSSRIDGITNNAINTPYSNTVGGFNNADFQTAQYRSDLNSYEWNFRWTHHMQRDQLVLSPNGEWHKQCTPGMVPSIILGVRWVALDEDFVWQSRINSLPLDQYRGDYTVNTKNDMIGVQLGGELTEQHCNWNWGVKVKGGIYANYCEQSSIVIVNDPRTNLFAPNRNEHVSAVDAALMGEIGLFMNYALTDHINFKAGYDFIFLTGLAQAADQVYFDNQPVRVIHQAYQFYNGGTLGLEITW